jgi:hypothetical protein
MAGLDPAIHVQISLPLDRDADVVMTFGVDQELKPIPFGKALGHALPMLPGTACKIAGDAGIENSVGPEFGA